MLSCLSPLKMSSDIYAKPDLSKKVRYSRTERTDGAECEQREVDIYETADDIRDRYAHIQSQEGGAQTQNPPSVQKGSFRWATLGLLCLLMLAGIIILSIFYILVRLEKEQLSISYSQLQADHSAIAADKIQLQEEVKWLKDELEEKCPEGWSRFKSSCYFKSTERKIWEESRRDCLDKGADLVIINSKEEQKFVSELNLRGESWIGLEANHKQTSGGYPWEYKWEWVDGSALKEKFWAPGFGNPSSAHSGVCCDDHGKWKQSSKYIYGYGHVYKPWICEK